LSLFIHGKQAGHILLLIILSIKTFSLNSIWNCMLCLLSHSLLEASTGSLVIGHMFITWCQNLPNVLVWIWDLRKKWSDTHSTPTLTSCNGTSCTNKVFSVEHYLLFSEFTYSMRWNKTSLLYVTDYAYRNKLLMTDCVCVCGQGSGLLFVK
jgi:hypothetical protein